MQALSFEQRCGYTPTLHLTSQHLRACTAGSLHAQVLPRDGAECREQGPGGACAHALAGPAGAGAQSADMIQLCARGASGLSPTKPPGMHWLWRATHCAGVSPRCRPSSWEAAAVHSAEAPPPLRSLEAREGCRAAGT